MSIYFSILFSPSSSTIKELSNSHLNPSSSPKFFSNSNIIKNLSIHTFELSLKSLILNPINFLIRFNLALLFIMSWYGIKMRGFRRNALGLNGKTSVGGGGEKQEKVGFMGTLKKLSGEAIEGKKPELISSSSTVGPPMAVSLI